MPFIENNLALSTQALNYLNNSIETLIKTGNIEALILGCTHYSVFTDYLETNYPTLKIIDSAQAQAEKLVGYLERHPELQQ